LDPDAGFRVRIIYGSNEQQTITVNGNILGVSEFLNADNYTRQWKWYLKIGVIGIVLILLLILSLIVPSSLMERLIRSGWAQTYQRQFVIFMVIYVSWFGLTALVLLTLARLFAVFPPEAPSNLT